MKYKEFARSPQYGKIFAYDKDGRVIEELDLLNLQIVAKNNEQFTLGALLDKIFDLTQENKEMNARIKSHDKDIMDLQNEITKAKADRDTLAAAIRSIAAKIDSDKI